jgi:type I restriction enzyme S subunit
MDSSRPATWKTSTLGAVAHGFLSGGTPSTKNEAFWRGSIPWITSKWINSSLYLDSGEKFISDDALRESATTLVPRNSLIFATRVGVGKVAVNRLDLAINQDLAGVLIDPNRYDIHFIAYQLRSERLQNMVALHKRGATIQGITRDNLKELEITLPPLPEQRKIAGVLGVVQRAMEQQGRLLALTAELKKVILHQIFTAGLRGEPQKQTEIGPVPEGWTATTLGELACEPHGFLQTGPFGSQLHKNEYLTEGIGVVNPTHLWGNRINHEDVPRVSSETAARLDRHFLEEGDILFARRGEIGRHGMVTKDEEGWLCGTGCFLARVRQEHVDNRFLSYLFSTKGVIAWLNGHSAGAIMPNLSNTVLRSMPVFFPLKEVQAEIADCLDATEQKIAIHQRKHAILTDLYRTLLHQLMTAQIRVHELDLDLLDCGDMSPLSEGATRRAGQSADVSAHSKKQNGGTSSHVTVRKFR